MEETRVFTGFMDLETSPEYFQEGDYLKARNVTKKTIDGGNGGRLSFANDFVLDDSATLPQGNNKTLKTVVNEATDTLYSVNFNSEGYHTILKYSGGNSTIIFTNLVDTLNQDLLNWDEDSIVNDLVVHQDRWLLMTDTVSDIKMFDLWTLEQGYGRPISTQDITLAKAPPSDSPEYYYVDTAALTSNSLTSKIFRFKYKFVYAGGFETSWSPSSSEVLPNNLNSIVNGLSSTKQNLIRVDIPVREVGVEKVMVAASVDGGEWVLIREITKDAIDALPTSRTNDLDEIRVGPHWIMSFYNPLAFNLIPADEADHNYEAIPRSAKTLDIVNDNTLLLAGLTEGYPRLENLDVELTPVQFREGDYGVITNRGTLKVKRVDEVESWGSNYRLYMYITLQGTPVAGDVISIVCNYKYRTPIASAAETFTFTVVTGETSLAEVYSGMANILPNGQVFTDGGESYVGFYYRDFNLSELSEVKNIKNVSIDLMDVGYVDLPTARTFKRGSTVQFALSYKDQYGRYFPLETNETFKVVFPQNMLFGYKLDWKINHTPPEGAVSYQWMVSEDMKHQTYVDTLGRPLVEQTKVGQYMVFDLLNLNRFNNRGIPGGMYTFTPGDRVYLRSRWSSYNGESPGLETLLQQRKELSVIGLEVVPISQTESNYLLRVEYNQDLWSEILSHYTSDGRTQQAIMLQLFTPKVVDSNLDTTLFREIGPTYRILDGSHTDAEGTLQGIDDFIRGRTYEAFTPRYARGFAVESRNISDDVSDIIPYRGNVRSYNDQIVGRDLRGSIRFSDVSTSNRVYNGINKFYEGRIYGEGPGETTRHRGWIRKIKVVGNYLKVLQEDEVGIIPVYLSILQDNSGNIQTADSDQLLNTVRYIGGGKIGIGKSANSFAVNERGVIFFFDSDRKVPYMLDGMSLRNVSSKLGSYFSTKSITPLLGSCLHEPHNEYWFTFDSEEGVQTLIMDVFSGRWVSFSDNIPETMANLNGEVFSFRNGLRYRLHKFSKTNTFYGVQYPSYLNVLFPAGFVRTFKSVAVHAGAQPETSEDGVKTSLEHTSDLLKKDFKLREGIWYANFLRDKASGLFTGKFLKGRWISSNFKFEPGVRDLELFKVVLKSKGSTPNE